jgi:hypothetical protein
VILASTSRPSYSLTSAVEPTWICFFTSLHFTSLHFTSLSSFPPTAS